MWSNKVMKRSLALIFVAWAALSLVIPATASAQTLSIISLPDEIGAGLQSGTVRARLSDSQHGGITITIQSSDSTLALVSPDEFTAGSTDLEVFVPNGSIDALFFVHPQAKKTR